MPADQPAVGETWVMTDPATGEPAQAVITDISETSIRLLSRQQRRLTFPVRSFPMMWRFVQEAPEQPCAHAQCGNQGYLQVNDLGRWVWVCHAHVPARVQFLLPTDNNLDNWTSEGAAADQCPSCNTSADSDGSSVREMEGHQVHRCGSCNALWARATGLDDDTLGVWGGEVVQEMAAVLESLGQRARAFVGRQLWQAMHEVLGPIANRGVAGVPVRMHTGNPLAVVLLGDQPSTRGVTTRGVQRLGGQPSRQNPGASIPEEGSRWVNSQTGKVLNVNQIRYASQTGGQSGRRIRIDGTDMESKNPVEVWLEDFVKEFVPHRTEPAVEETAPCNIGEEFADSTGKVVEVVDIEAGQIVVKLDSGNKALIPTGIFRTRYTKVPPRRSALDRVLDDD
jgi:hypothetical protein